MRRHVTGSNRGGPGGSRTHDLRIKSLAVPRPLRAGACRPNLVNPVHCAKSFVEIGCRPPSWLSMWLSSAPSTVSQKSYETGLRPERREPVIYGRLVRLRDEDRIQRRVPCGYAQSCRPAYGRGGLAGTAPGEAVRGRITCDRPAIVDRESRNGPRLGVQQFRTHLAIPEPRARLRRRRPTAAQI